jgi:hypothetical protein
VPRTLRAAVLVVAVGLLSSCTTTQKTGTAAQLPSLSSVVSGRFVSQVELDSGNLVVKPAGKMRARISLDEAQALFRATDAVDGAYRFAVLGLGVTTVATDVAPATTTTTTGPGTATSTTSGTAPGSVAGTTTSTTHPAPSTTTGASTTTMSSSTSTKGGSATTGTTTTTTASLAPATLPRYDNRLAWVGIAWGADCPERAGAPRLATRYVAVVIDADTGRSVIAYTSRSSVACSGPVLPASVSRPNELVSVPWEPQGPTSTAVRVTVPACGAYFGWTQVQVQGTASIQVVASKPFDPECGSTASTVQTVDSVVPLGAAQSKVPHAALGPVDGLRTLPGG